MPAVKPIHILVANSGSSTFKFCRYEYSANDQLQVLSRGEVEGADAVAAWFEADPGQVPATVGHRVVHGGTEFSSPVVVDEDVLRKLHELIPLAPLHQPANLAGIEAARRRFPGVPQVACFDTAFHRGHPKLADIVPLPWRFHEAGIRRYGFHGLSYEYIASTLPLAAPEIARGRVVVAHLGSGASLCAISDGKSVDSTMSFTALDGICMSTRPGSMDPGAVLYLLQNQRLTPGEVEAILYRESGLLGISGISGDMRVLLASSEPRAKLAVDFFVWRIAKEIGAMAAVLDGMDALVFTAGIGEHSAPIRKRICEACRWLSVEIDDTANFRGGPLISTARSRASAWVIPTDEELMIARHTTRAAGLLR